MRRVFPLLALLFAIALLGSACASTKDTGFPPIPTSTPTSASPTATPSGPTLLSGPIGVVDSAFDPKDATVKVGQKVEWKQSGTAPHTVTSDDGKMFESSPDCPADIAKCMQAGSEFSFTFTKPGKYPYYCRLHGTPGGVGMAGTITVEG